MKLLSYACLLLAVASPLCAQRYILKDGRQLNQADVVVKDGKLVRSAGGAGDGVVEVSYPISQVVRLDWPEPEELAATAQLLATGKPVEAEAKITPVYRLFASFSKLPGSWWSDAAVLRMRSFLAQTKLDEAEKAAREVISSASDQDAVGAAQLVLAEVQIRQEKTDIADAMLNEILKKDLSAEVSARAVILRGDIAYARKNFEQAIELYLQVPAFFGTREELMPAALLGSARSYVGYGDKARAERAYQDLLVAYPNSPEAVPAKREITTL